LLDHHGSLAYKPSVLSAASLYLAQRNELHYSTSPHWDPTTHHDTTEPRAWVRLQQIKRRGRDEKRKALTLCCVFVC
jgi:hypothetical protein